jgi:general secretion pathway protein D
MLFLKELRRVLAVLTGALLLLQPMEARTRKGEKLVKEGSRFELKMQWEEALKKYEEAFSTDPNDPEYRMAVQRARFQAGQGHVDKGLRLRLEGKWDEAMKEFETALKFDAGSSLARQEIERTREIAERAKNPRTDKETLQMPAIERARREAEKKMARAIPAPELKPLTGKFSSLRMNNQTPQRLYETVSKLAGINVIFDPDGLGAYGTKTFSLDLANVTLDEALDYLALLTKTFWKPVSGNAIFITQDNIGKRREFEDQVVKTFYLKNVGTVQELTELITVIRAVTQIGNIFQFNTQFAIMVRAPRDKMAIVEKFIADMDKPRPEVIVDIIVMEATRAKSREISAFLQGGGLRLPLSFAPRSPVTGGGGSGGSGRTDLGTGLATTTTATAQGVRLSELRNLNESDWALSIPNALLTLTADDRQVRVLQNPQVRALDGFKATLRIGQKIPVASAQIATGGVGGIGGIGFPQTTIQQQEVGVNVDITPKVHANDEISMHVVMEVSNVADRIDIGGISQPIIGQRKVEHDIRIRNGEPTVLAGINQSQDTQSRAGLPGLINVPILRRLFGEERVEQSRGDVLVVLVPRIVRQVDVQEVNTREVLSGQDQNYKVSFAPEPETASGEAPAAPPAPASPVAAPVASPVKPEE